MTAWHQNSELTVVQCECHIGRQTVIARINPTNRNYTADVTFSRNFCFFVPISRGEEMPVLLSPADAHDCNLVFCSFVLRTDWLKPFLTDHAITCYVNGFNSFICWWYNTMIVTMGRKVRFHHKLHFMTKRRCSSAAVTSRLHQNFGIIDTTVATSDILTWHQMRCFQISFWCLMFCRQIWCWLGCFCFPHAISFN